MSEQERQWRPHKVASELIRPDASAPVSDVVSGVIDQVATEKMALQRRAWVAWHRANGDRERAHTVYVTLKRPRRAGADPIVVVGVDSHSFASDVSANKEIYLSRLANVGFAASALEVRIARRRATPAKPKAAAPTRPRVTGELTADERAYVERMVARLPDSIKPSASKALEKSILRKRSF